MRSIYSLSQPRIYAALARIDMPDAQRVITGANAASFLFGLASLAGLWLAGPWLLSLFGKAFPGALPIALILCLTFLVRAVFGPAMAILAGRGRERQIALVLVASLIISLAGCVIFYPAFGILAVAWCYTIANAFSAAALWWIARTREGIDCAIWASVRMPDMRTGETFLASMRRMMVR